MTWFQILWQIINFRLLFNRCKKPNILLAFISQYSFSVSKDIRLNLTHYFIMKISNKTELKTMATDYSAKIDYQNFKKICRECTKELLIFWQ